jgi:hypothetical protein
VSPATDAAADGVGVQHELHAVIVRRAVQGDGTAFVEHHGDGFWPHGHLVAPEGDAHDRLDDRDALVEVFEVLRFVRGAEDVRVG